MIGIDEIRNSPSYAAVNHKAIADELEKLRREKQEAHNWNIAALEEAHRRWPEIDKAIIFLYTTILGPGEVTEEDLRWARGELYRLGVDAI